MWVIAYIMRDERKKKNVCRVSKKENTSRLFSVTPPHYSVNVSGTETCLSWGMPHEHLSHCLAVSQINRNDKRRCLTWRNLHKPFHLNVTHCHLSSAVVVSQWEQKRWVSLPYRMSAKVKLPHTTGNCIIASCSFTQFASLVLSRGNHVF